MHHEKIYPLVVHTRSAEKETLKILKNNSKKKSKNFDPLFYRTKKFCI